MNRTILISALALAAFASGCQRSSAAKTSAATDTKDVAAIVNGVPIRRVDLELRLEASKKAPHQAVAEKELTEAIIREELAAQRAIALGLDSDPAYQAELRRMEAQENAWRREHLSALLYRSAQNRAVSEEDARRYYEENTKLVGTEYHVEQVLVRSEQAALTALAELQGGAAFSDVFPKHVAPAGSPDQKPWDLGYLRWSTVPEQWLPVLGSLADGELSGVIRGENRRFWVIRVIDRRESPQAGFEAVKPQIMDYLQRTGSVRARLQLDRDLRAAARVELRALPPLPTPPQPTDD